MTTGAIRHAKLQSNHHHQQTNSNTQCFTGRMPFLLPNQQCRSTEGKISHTKDLLIPNSSGSLLTLFLTTKGSWLVWGGLPCLSSASWCQYPRCQNRNWLLLIISNIWLFSWKSAYGASTRRPITHRIARASWRTFCATRSSDTRRRSWLRTSLRRRPPAKTRSTHCSMHIGRSTSDGVLLLCGLTCCGLALNCFLYGDC